MDSRTTHKVVQFELMPQSLEAQFRKDFPPYVDGLVRTKPGNFVISPKFAEHAHKIYNFPPRNDDVYVLTYPKSGTTWMQELVWMVMYDCDYEKAKESLLIRSPFLEMDYLLPKTVEKKLERTALKSRSSIPLVAKLVDMLYDWKVVDLFEPVVKTVRWLMFGDRMRDLKAIDHMSSPRVIKSHLPFYLLNPDILDKSKVVYVARNPKDVIVSYYHYHRLLEFHKFSGDLETFAEYFIRDELYCSPFFPHLIDAWDRRHHPNMYFVFYEDLKQDLPGQIRKIAQFLGKPLADEQIAKLSEHLRFDNFAKNESVNMEFAKEIGSMNNTGHFIRKGKTGDWKNHFSPDLNRRIDEWIAANLAKTDLRFVMELDKQD